MTLILAILAACCIVAAAWLGARRYRLARDHEEAVADDALRKLYWRYWAEVGALTQTHMLKASDDEEWLGGIRARAPASNAQAPRYDAEARAVAASLTMAGHQSLAACIL
jgi:hypothetical protein